MNQRKVLFHLIKMKQTDLSKVLTSNDFQFAFWLLSVVLRIILCIYLAYLAVSKAQLITQRNNTAFWGNLLICFLAEN